MDIKLQYTLALEELTGPVLINDVARVVRTNSETLLQRFHISGATAHRIGWLTNTFVKIIF